MTYNQDILPTLKTKKFGKTMILLNKHAINPYEPIGTNITEKPQTWLEISAAAFNHNITYYKKLIGLHNTLAIVIKGNGYGHGLHQMAYLCEQNEFVDWLLVAQLSEGLALQNISKPILVLGYSDVSPQYAVGKNIHFMVDSLEYAQKLNTIGMQHKYQFNVHVKVDTGLSRIGVLASDAHVLIQQLQDFEYIKLNGIFSHFAASNDNPTFTEHQLAQFNNVLTQLDEDGIAIQNIHMSNSAAINTIAYPTKFNFFRLGLGAYGLGAHTHHLQPIMNWKTYIASIKTIPINSYVSYACTYKAQRITRIALLPIGYADGYDFRFSNKTSVLINGSLAPILGRVAMNITIVDVTDVIAQIGDEVTLIGKHPGIDAQDLANMAEMPNVRELFTGINPALTRIITD
jgi:alanine racemase